MSELLGLVSALNHHYNVKPVYMVTTLSCFEVCMWYLEVSFARRLYMGPILHPAIQKQDIYMTLLHIRIFHVILQEKTLVCGSQVGHMLVTSGLLCGSVGQVGQQV